MRGLLSLTVLVASTCLAQPSVEVPCDALGVRRFSAVPPAGVHPRVLLSPEDLPRWREQVARTHRGGAFFAKRFQSKVIDRLLALGPALSDQELVAGFADNGPTHEFLQATMDAVYHQDAERQTVVARAVTNFARVLLARSRVDPKWGKVKTDVNGVRGLNGIPSGLGEIWYRGGSSFALSYDFLYDAMTPEQRSVCRQAIATSVKDLVTWGMGFPKGRAVSNWYAYHGEIPLMWLAIEGEEGFDPARYGLFTQLLHNWFDVALHPGGGGNEDGYMANTGFREGTMAMIALARRGDNLFHHPNYLPYWTWVIQSLPPGGNGGQSVSYACNAVSPYESMPALSRWAMPGNPLVNYYFAQYKGADYTRNNQWQYNDLSTLLAMDYEDSPKLPLDPARLGLPLTATFPQLGLMTTRSDWGPEALYLNFYVRQDAWMDRHESIDRGRFVLCAGGRSWVGGSWNNSESPGGETLVQIDGKGERVAEGRGRMITPNGNLVASFDSPAFSAGCMDLKRCYDWQWANGFDSPGPGWEPETSTPAQLGWLWPNPALPAALFGGDNPKAPAHNFTGLNLWRKLANPVRFAFRTCALARGAHPYAIIVDDFQKDDQPHRYESYLQVPTDITLTPKGDAGYLLGEPGPRQLLLRPLGAQVKVAIEDYTIPGYGGKPDPRRRVVLTADAVSPDFRLLLCPVREGQLPTVAADGKGATLRWPDQQDALSFARDANGLTQMTVRRGGQALFGGFGSLRLYPSARPMADRQ